MNKLDVQSVTPGGSSEDIPNRHLGRPIAQHDRSVLQSLLAFPQDLKHRPGRPIDLIRSRGGSGQSPFGVLRSLEDVHDAAGVGISDSRVEDIVLFVQGER